MSPYRSRTTRKHRHFSPASRWISLCIGLILVGIAVWLIDSRCSKASEKPKAQELSRGNALFPLGMEIPADIPSEMVDYEGFTVSFNNMNHTPNYCMWELTGDETEGAVSRSNAFTVDDRVSGCPNTSDYKGSGYDRGHIVPAADQKWSEKAMSDCFYLTNICPQSHGLNTGMWNTLENWERKIARSDSSIYIISGPIYTDNDRELIGATGVRVPSAFFKVIVSPYADSPRGIAFVFPNMKCEGNMRDYSCTIDRLEEMTGYNFFPALTQEQEKMVESVTSFKEWEKVMRNSK